MGDHVSNVVKVGYFHLRQLRIIRKYLTVQATKTLVHATIVSRLDYANALLYGIPEKQLERLQRLQNHAARLITNDSSSVHSKDILKRLHWLPVRARIQYKILLLTFKSLNGLAPSYLRDLLTIQVPQRSTRLSANGVRLVVPRSKLRFGGDRAFSITAPRLWNELPSDLRSTCTLNQYKRGLKTFLFSNCFM